MKKNKFVVLDVNVWITVFLNKQFSLVEKAVDDGLITILSSDDFFIELVRVLNYKKFKKKWLFPIEEYVNFCKNNTFHFPTIPVFTDCRDPKDNYLFDLAIQAQADYLVSGDGDVLCVKIEPPPQIILFAQFREIFL